MALCVFLFFSDSSSAFQAGHGAIGWRRLARYYHVGADGLSVCWCHSPRRWGCASRWPAPVKRPANPRLASRMLLSLGAVLGALVALDALILALFWTLSPSELARELAARRGREERTAAGIFRFMLAGSALLPFFAFCLGLAVPGWGRREPSSRALRSGRTGPAWRLCQSVGGDAARRPAAGRLLGTHRLLPLPPVDRAALQPRPQAAGAW